MTAPWTSRSLIERLELGEDSRVEFKEASFRGRRVEAPHRDSLADELAALSNTLGGTLILSVSDAGEVRPLDREQLDRLESYVGICADSIDPPLAFVTQRMALPQGPVLVVEIGQSESVHRSPGGYLRRQGSSKRELSPGALRRLFQQRGRSGLTGPVIMEASYCSAMMRRLAIGDVPGAGDRRYFLQERGEGVPIIYDQTRSLTGQDPSYELLGSAELLLTIPGAPPPVRGITGSLTVNTRTGPLAGARVVVHYPNGTWMAADSDTFGRVQFDFHSQLPITVFCAAQGYTAHVERAWRPPEPLSIQLKELPGGGSAIFAEGSGHLPGLVGRMNPILDDLDRTYLYATNIAIDEGKIQPVHFRLRQPLLLTDVNGSEWTVRFLEMIGKSAVLEYRPPSN